MWSEALISNFHTEWARNDWEQLKQWAVSFFLTWNERCSSFRQSFCAAPVAPSLLRELEPRWSSVVANLLIDFFWFLSFSAESGAFSAQANDANVVSNDPPFLRRVRKMRRPRLNCHLELGLARKNFRAAVVLVKLLWLAQTCIYYYYFYYYYSYCNCYYYCYCCYCHYYYYWLLILLLLYWILLCLVIRKSLLIGIHAFHICNGASTYWCGYVLPWPALNRATHVGCMHVNLVLENCASMAPISNVLRPYHCSQATLGRCTWSILKHIQTYTVAQGPRHSTWQQTRRTTKGTFGRAEQEGDYKCLQPQSSCCPPRSGQRQ